MKQSELLLATLTEAVAALVKRMGEVEGIARIPGEKGDTGADGRDGRDADPVSDEQIKAAAAEWLAANITQPADGRDGADGQDGQDAPPITAEQIQLAVDLWFEINRDSIRGADGINGLNGRDGIDGTNGADGRNGIDGTSGKDGADGVGIALIEQRDDASFHITLDDGREFQIDLPEPKRTSILGGGGGGGIKEIQPGTGILVDNTDPRRPIITALGGGDSFLSLPAAGNVIAYRVVTTDADGLVIYGDAGTVAHQGRILGVCINSASAGGNVAIAQQGLVTNSGWNWTAGAELYVGLNGDITTQQVGAFSQNLGYAISATQIFIRLGRAVVRG